MLRKVFSAVVIVLGAVVGAQYYSAEDSATPVSGGSKVIAESGPSAITRAWRDRRSGLQVRERGTVTRILADDNNGDRHQRFVLELASGQTVLVAHNIDLAPRIDKLREGDQVEFFGEYEWNERGGVIHWTHHDPASRHVGGWLEHAGRRYE